MTLKHWYFFLLGLPDFIPGIIWLVGLTHPPADAMESFSFSGLLYSHTLYWLNNLSIPYILFGCATLVMALYQKMTLREIQTASWRLPLYFAPLFLLVFYVNNTNPSFSLLSAPMFSIFIAICVIAAGYFYVLLAHTMTWLMLKARLLSD